MINAVSLSNTVTAIRRIVHPDGSASPNHKYLCTSPIHYARILADVTMHYASDPGFRFVHQAIPLSQVQETLERLGH